MNARRIDVLAALLGATATAAVVALLVREWFKPWPSLVLDDPMLEDWR